MVPTIVEARLKNAEAVAEQLRTDAQAMFKSAQTIDELVRLVRLANWEAKLNHDTIVARNEA